MPAISITRGSAAPVMRRGDVEPGQVFAYKGRANKLGENYAAIGRNGRLYAVKLSTGELASSGKEDREVTVTGKWNFHVNNTPTPSVVRECRRSEVRSGEVFHVVGKSEQYAHVGEITRAMNGFLSVPLNRTENHAITRNGNSRVKVVATYEMAAELAS